MNGFIIAQRLLDILELASKGAAALPLIIAMGLVFGRRGKGLFCLWGNFCLSKLALLLAFCGPIYFIGNYISQMLAINAQNFWGPFFSAAGMNYSLSLLLWLCGMLAFYFGTMALAAKLADPAFTSVEKYALANLKGVLWPMLLAALLFFLTFISSHWPFGGYPAEISRERVFMAIMRDAARGYFMAFAPAGAIACAYAVYCFAKKHNFDADLISAAIRWCALWAFVGYLPHFLQHLGILLGAGARANAFNNPQLHLWPQIFALALLFMGIFCFALLLFKKNAPRLLAYIGLCIFFCAQILPKIAG